MSIVKFSDHRGQQVLEFSWDSSTSRLSSGSMVYPVDQESVTIEGRKVTFACLSTPEGAEVWLDGEVYRVEYFDHSRKRTSSASGGASDGSLKAQMPGKLLQIGVHKGQLVESGQQVALMESMKMELALEAPFAGEVVEIHQEPGAMLAQGDLVVTLKKIQS